MSGPTLELTNTIVRAGAGTGKTTGLVEKVVEVYRRFHGQSDPHIVVTTFTRKAMQELKERLILRAVTDKDPELLQFVSDPARLHISTIHGLLNLFLKQVGHLAELDSGFQIVDEAEGEHLARLALREVLVANSEYLRWLEVYGFARVLSMCRSYQGFRREQGELRAGSVSEIKAAVTERLKYWRGRFLPLIAEIARHSDAKLSRYAEDMTNYVKSWVDGIPAREGLPKKPNRSAAKQPELEPWHEAMASLLKSFRDEIDKPFWNKELWPQMVASWQEFQPFAEEFYRRLQQIKDEQARFEMNDLELKSLEVLRTSPELAAVFSEAWDFWMIDEYQDTSPLQVEVLDALIGSKPKYLVGDPQQSIYLFRGAEVGVFDKAEKAIRAGGGQTIGLTKNYRSEPALLMWINDFMASMGDSFVRMEPREVPDVEPAASVTLFRAPDVDAEAKGIVACVAGHLQKGARLEQICVISRTHRGLMDISKVLKSYGYPTHVHAARGFNSRREVIDAQALWKFLANPHDNLNLLILLRSPWFFIEDWRLAEWMNDRPNSLWRRLAHLEDVPEPIERLKKCQRDTGDSGMVRSFENALRANALLDLSLENDPAGRKESNLWKLIHKAQTLEKEGGRSILDLLNAEIENPLDATEGDATSAQEPNCINLMTIHGSKGLEFDHVIIPRMSEAPKTSNTPDLFAEHGAYFFPVWDDSEAAFVSSPLDFQAIKRRRERELEEYDRWLYVALTRAKKSLTLSWSADGRDSWVSRSPWFNKEKGRHGIVEITSELPEPIRYNATTDAAVLVRPPFQLPSVNSDERRSVTELIETDVKLDKADLLRRWQAQTAGSRIHRSLEALKYLGVENNSDDPAIQFVLGLQDPPLKEWIRDGFTEWGFQVKTPLRVVEGQIDLWVETKDTIYIVDYKSGSPAQKEIAFRQLSLYSWALRKFAHKKPITMLVIYPLIAKVETRPFTEELFLGWEAELSRP